MPVTVNMEKAKEKARRILRIQREPLLLEQDVKFQRALETGEDTSTIVAEKQRLRDLPELVETVSTLEGLKSLNA